MTFFYSILQDKKQCIEPILYSLLEVSYFGKSEKLTLKALHLFPIFKCNQLACSKVYRIFKRSRFVRFPEEI